MLGKNSNSKHVGFLLDTGRPGWLTVPKRAKRLESGFSLIELLIVVAIILIIAAIAIPNLLHAKIAANQAAAVENVRTVTSASIVYFSTYGNGFPDSLATLGGVDPASCSGAVLIDEVLSTTPHEKTGYTFDYAPIGASLPTPADGCPAGYNQFLVTAVPTAVGSTGNYSYCADEPGVVRFDPSGNKPASVASCDALSPLQ